MQDSLTNEVVILFSCRISACSVKCPLLDARVWPRIFPKKTHFWPFQTSVVVMTILDKYSVFQIRFSSLVLSFQSPHTFHTVVNYRSSIYFSCLSPATQRLLTWMTTAQVVRRVYKTFRLSLWKISGTWPLLCSSPHHWKIQSAQLTFRMVFLFSFYYLKIFNLIKHNFKTIFY